MKSDKKHTKLIRETILLNAGKVLTAMRKSHMMIPTQFKRSENPFIEMIKTGIDYADDTHTCLLVDNNFQIYLLTKKEVKEGEFGESDNEIVVPIDEKQSLVVVGI
jgi:hypothetical protein